MIYWKKTRELKNRDKTVLFTYISNRLTHYSAVLLCCNGLNAEIIVAFSKILQNKLLQIGWKSVILVSCVEPFPVKVSCTPPLLSIVACTGIPLHISLLMRFEDATIQDQDLPCNPISLYDEQEFSLFNICIISFLPANLWIVSLVSRCFCILFFFE